MLCVCTSIALNYGWSVTCTPGHVQIAEYAWKQNVLAMLQFLLFFIHSFCFAYTHGYRFKSHKLHNEKKRSKKINKLPLLACRFLFCFFVLFCRLYINIQQFGLLCWTQRFEVRQAISLLKRLSWRTKNQKQIANSTNNNNNDTPSTNQPTNQPAVKTATKAQQ